MALEKWFWGAIIGWRKLPKVSLKLAKMRATPWDKVSTFTLRSVGYESIGSHIPNTSSPSRTEGPREMFSAAGREVFLGAIFYVDWVYRVLALMGCKFLQSEADDLQPDFWWRGFGSVLRECPIKFGGEWLHKAEPGVDEHTQSQALKSFVAPATPPEPKQISLLKTREKFSLSIEHLESNQHRQDDLQPTQWPLLRMPPTIPFLESLGMVSSRVSFLRLCRLSWSSHWMHFPVVACRTRALLQLDPSFGSPSFLQVLETRLAD